MCSLMQKPWFLWDSPLGWTTQRDVVVGASIQMVLYLRPLFKYMFKWHKDTPFEELQVCFGYIGLFRFDS